jgi:hypothetical protein
MKVFVLCGVLSLSVGTYAGEPDTSPKVIEEPTLHDHYVAMKQMQQRLAGRSLDEQAKMQPQIQRAQQKACARLRKDHQERVPSIVVREETNSSCFRWSLNNGARRVGKNILRKQTSHFPEVDGLRVVASAG